MAQAVGWELRVERLGLQRDGARTRTYGRYQVLVNGAADPALTGYICESPGPSDNDHPGSAKRILPGVYPLWTQFGSYRSIGYAEGDVAGGTPMPALALEATGRRNGILIHPAHPPGLFLSSIGCLNPTRELPGAGPMDFFDSRRRVIALIDSLRAYAPGAFEHEVMSRLGDATITITGDPMQAMDAAPSGRAAFVEPASLPISKTAALSAATWLMTNFEVPMTAAVAGKPYGLKHVCGIACQETAYKWVPWIKTQSVDTIVQRAVFDASGDFEGAPRSAFPVNTSAFRAKFGDDLTDMLIEEGNKTRRLQGWSDRPWVYKGYGLFQYDLQFILNDKPFFADRKWYAFASCMEKLVEELDEKLIAQKGDLWEAIRAYNGRGPRAEAYRENVRTFSEWCAAVTGD